MIKHFDHFTIVVEDEAEAKRFFSVLGFVEDASVVIKGARFADYMGVPGLEARHVTLVAQGVAPRTEIQLLKFLHPEPLPDPHIRDLHKIGFNHVCFAVDDIADVVGRVEAAGFATRAGILDFHSRKLAFLWGPGGVTVELAEWVAS
ncbi:MAG TPA: VOC family protein [Acetobacteraceae bacterium]|nr:VOC family protein [Acetobacteraceae bacterium]